VRPDRRLYLLAIVSGLVAEGGLALAVFGGAPRALAILLPVEAIALGVTFGARPGMVGAVLPWVVLYGAELVRRALGHDASESAVQLLVAVLFVALLLGFLAGITGALRDRYVLRR